MIIHRIINNNFAVILDSFGVEKVVMGKGICFGRKVGAAIPFQTIEKSFILENKEIRERFKTMVQEVSQESVDISEQIIKKAHTVLKNELNENIYVSLTDHIQFAINRFHQGIQMKNELLWHIRAIYPDEFKLGMEAVDLIENKCGIRLLEDECSFIALHLVAAQINEDIHSTINITKLIKDIMSIISKFFQIRLDEESLDYYRFVTHLKFFAQRLLEKRSYSEMNGEADPLFLAVKTSYPKSFDCANRIGWYIETIQKNTITNEELLYLTIHIQRIIYKNKA
jgi:beta-glucoside operon transcriptional antiterminator